MRARLFASLLCLGLAAAAARADDVSDSIDEAAKAYADGDLAGAKAALETAAQMIGDRRAAELMKALPAPLEGWTAQDGESQAMAAAFMGGGTHVSRAYAKGDDRIEISVIIDSPMVMSVLGMISSPAAAAAMGKTVKIGKQKAILTHEGQLQMIVANRALVSIAGSADAQIKKSYAEKIDVKALEAF